MMDREQIQVYGEVIPLVEVAGGPGVNARLPAVEVIEALLVAGLDEDEAAEVAGKLKKEAYDVPSAWASVDSAELQGLGIPRGRIKGVIAAMQKTCVRNCGMQFARLMEGGSEKTDQEVAAAIMRAKHVPQAPAVKEETGWAPRVDEWREYVLALASWLGTLDPEQALTVRRILSDWESDPTTWTVQARSRRSMALGSVLRGQEGLKQMTLLVGEAAMEAGCGLLMLVDLCGTLLTPEDEVGFAKWQHPEPITQAYMVEAGVLAWAAKTEETAAGQRQVCS